MTILTFDVNCLEGLLNNMSKLGCAGMALGVLLWFTVSYFYDMQSERIQLAHTIHSRPHKINMIACTSILPGSDSEPPLASRLLLRVPILEPEARPDLAFFMGRFAFCFAFRVFWSDRSMA